MANPKLSREIVVLDDASHILLRSSMYIGAVEPQEEKIPLILNGSIVNKQKVYSIGMYKLLDEVLDNAFDEAKRCYAENIIMKEIIVSLNSQTNEVSVQDTGRGFHKGLVKNKKTMQNNIVTAVSQLRAGSNFANQETEASLIGTNGVGVSVVNVLSDYFAIETSDGTYSYKHVWEKFETTDSQTTNEKTNQHGTKITFIPRKEVFKAQKWDSEIIYTKLAFKEFIRSYSKELKTLKLTLYVDGKKVDLTKPFIEPNNVYFENKHMKVWLWPEFTDSVNVSFVNGAQCTGIHQKLLQEWVNSNIFDSFDKAHYYYRSLVLLELPPKKVVFGDQNKTKFIGTREDLEPIVKFKMSKNDFINNVAKTKFYKETLDKIYNSLERENINQFKKAKKERKQKIVSDKYFPSQIKDTLFICEGLSAMGSINQARDPKLHSVYALKGKVKHVRSLQDMTENQEIIDLINILELDPQNQGSTCAFRKIVISADADSDGAHITGLLMNFFYYWFPKLIEHSKIYILKTPLVGVAINKTEKNYFYSLEDFGKFENVKKSAVSYFKGLGSLSADDWKFVFANPSMDRLVIDKDAAKYMNIAFGDSVLLRKRWLGK